MAYVQPLLCVTVCGCPPIEMVPMRCGPVFAVAVKLTVPFPLPLAPAVIVIQVSVVVAVHAHEETAVTPICVPAPPAAATVWLVGLMAMLQPLA